MSDFLQFLPDIYNFAFRKSILINVKAKGSLLWGCCSGGIRNESAVCFATIQSGHERRTLLKYLWENYQFLCDFFRAHLPQFSISKPEGTYLVWVDCYALGKPSTEICEEILQKARVWLNAGDMYDTIGSHFVRINIACPRARLQEALERIATVWGK